MEVLYETNAMPVIIQILAIIASVDCIPTIACNRLKIGDNWFDRTILYQNIGRPYNLNINKASNTLFFSYSVPDSYSDVDFQLAYLNLDNNDHQVIAGIKGGCAVAIDQINDEIYLGGSDGIFKFNMLTKLADLYREKGKNIWSLYFKKNLFYISYPEQKLHIEIDGNFARIREFENIEIDNFHISSTDNSMYFANKSGLYKYDSKQSKVVSLNELVTVRQIVEDNNGDTYICTNFGVFIDGKQDGVKKILDMKNVYGLAFDRDNNFIYSDDKSIIKLSFSIVGCVENRTHW